MGIYAGTTTSTLSHAIGAWSENSRGGSEFRIIFKTNDGKSWINCPLIIQLYFLHIEEEFSRVLCSNNVLILLRKSEKYFEKHGEWINCFCPTESWLFWTKLGILIVTTSREREMCLLVWWFDQFGKSRKRGGVGKRHK